MLNLARLIMKKQEPLGVGLKKGCWAGVAIDLARQNNCTMVDYYGLPMNEVKEKIKLNNQTQPSMRNVRMTWHTLWKAVS